MLTVAPSSDIAAIAALAHAIWPTAYKDVLKPQEISNMLDRIYHPGNLRAEMEKGHRFFLAADDRGVCGYASGYLEDDVIWLKKLYVLPERQGEGIGSALMRAVMDGFAPARELRLLVNRGNTPAQRYYEARGMLKAGEMPVRMGDYDFVDYVYSLALTPAE